MARRGPRPLVAGNWKMNGTMGSLGEVERLVDMLAGADVGCDIMICPPATLIAPMAQALASSSIRLVLNPRDVPRPGVRPSEGRFAPFARWRNGL